MRCTKFKKNNCMESSIVFFFDDSSKKTVAFQSKQDRNIVYDNLEKIAKREKQILNVHNINFFNSLHKERLKDIIVSSFGGIEYIE